MPSSTLRFRSLLVDARRVRGRSGVAGRITSEWMSGELMPVSRRCQVSPMSGLCHRPSISTPAHTAICIVRVGGKARHAGIADVVACRADGCAFSFCHDAPPSRERYKPPGHVPANSVSGCEGWTSSDHTTMPACHPCPASKGVSRRRQLSPPSSVRYTPASVPAYRVRGSFGCAAKARTSASINISPHARRNVSPPSPLRHTACPAVPT